MEMICSGHGTLSGAKLSFSCVTLGNYETGDQPAVNDRSLRLLLFDPDQYLMHVSTVQQSALT